MKLKEFLENPAGKGDSALNRTALINTLNQKYERLLREKGNLFKVTLYHQLNSDNYFIHLVIPTETERDNTYDVVLYFMNVDGVKKESLLHTHDMQFFCNAPSFAYTFAKVYRDNGLFIESLINKFPDEIFKGSPDVRNRYGIVNYDKYLYFGCKYVHESRILTRATIDFRSLTYAAPIFDSRIRTLDKIMIEYKKAKNKLKKKKEDDIKEKTHNITDKRHRGSSIREINKMQSIQKKQSAKKTVSTIKKKTPRRK